MVGIIDRLRWELRFGAVITLRHNIGARNGHDCLGEASFEQTRAFGHGVSTFRACSAAAIRRNRITTVRTEPSRMTTSATAKSSPRASKSGSSNDARLAITSTHMRAGLAMGPSKKLPTPLAAPRVRTYAVKMAKAAADQPNTTPQSTLPVVQIPKVAYPAVARSEEHTSELQSRGHLV